MNQHAEPVARVTDRTEAQQAFTRIHAENRWRGGQSTSGPSSSLATTRLLREQLAQLFIDLDIHTLCDAPCGDANWITEITTDLDLYFGFDIVEELVIENLQRYQRMNHFFRVADVTHDILPKADAILCRDCLVHLPLSDGVRVINNFRQSGSMYLIATTFPS